MQTATHRRLTTLLLQAAVNLDLVDLFELVTVAHSGLSHMLVVDQVLTTIDAVASGRPAGDKHAQSWGALRKAYCLHTQGSSHRLADTYARRFTHALNNCGLQVQAQTPIAV